jgi:hypothetical protein
MSAKTPTAARVGCLLGRAVQVDPIKPTLSAPGSKCLKLSYDISLSFLLHFCFQFQLAPLDLGGLLTFFVGIPFSYLGAITRVYYGPDSAYAEFEAGAFTRPPFGLS